MFARCSPAIPRDSRPINPTNTMILGLGLGLGLDCRPFGMADPNRLLKVKAMMRRDYRNTFTYVKSGLPRHAHCVAWQSGSALSLRRLRMQRIRFGRSC